MKKIARTLTVTLGAAVMALAFGTAAHAGGPHISIAASLPLPPLPPIPVPFGFVDVNVPAHVHGPGVCTPGCADVVVYEPEYRTVYRNHYYNGPRHRHFRDARRDFRMERREARRDFRFDKREARRDARFDRREARRDLRDARRDWRHGRGYDGWR